MPIRSHLQSRTGKLSKKDKPVPTARREIDARKRKAMRRSVKKHGKDAQWYAMRVRSGAETVDGYRMVAKGFAVFVLFGMVERKANRFSKEPQEYYFNKVPGLVLFGVPNGMDGMKVLDQMGFLRRVVGINDEGGKVARINPADIKAWAKMHNVPGFSEPCVGEGAAPVQRFEVGQSVEVVDGPFTGHILTAKEIGASVTKAELKFLGELRMVMVPTHSLVRVG